MGKVSYANLKLKVKNETKVIDFEGNGIEVLQYLPIEDKYDLIMIALQKSMEDGIYNELLLDAYMKLNIVYMYSNLSFTEKQRDNEFRLYDTLESNGIIEAIMSNIPEDELEVLYFYLDEIQTTKTKYNKSAVSLFKSFIQDLPKNAEAAAKIVENFDPQRYQQVIDFATAANGGRNINTNK